MHSTDLGFLNRNKKNIGKNKFAGTDHMQVLYDMECQNCVNTYFANVLTYFIKNVQNVSAVHTLEDNKARRCIISYGTYIA